MNCLTSVGGRIMSRDPDRQTAEIRARIAIVTPNKARGTVEISNIA